MSEQASTHFLEDPSSQPPKIIESFRQAIAAAGITPPHEITPDGTIHKYPTNGRRTDRAGWYILHLDGTPAGAFGDWRTGAESTWSAKTETDMDPAEAEAYRARMEKIRAERDRARKERAAQARQKAIAEWESATPATDHPYLRAKGIEPHGARTDHRGRLLIPIRNPSGEIESLQAITPDNGTFKKRFTSGSHIRGGRYDLGDIATARRAFIVEGFSTGATIRQATGAPVVVAFNAGNLEPVIAQIRADHPDIKLTIAADDDRFKSTNAGREKATAAAQKHNCAVVFPTFTDLATEPTDFNDLAALEGIEAVKKQLNRPSEPEPLSPSDTRVKGRLTSPPPPPEYIARIFGRGFIPKNIVGAVVATGGTGKTAFLLQFGLALAGGPRFRPFGFDGRPAEVLLIQGEDGRDEIDRRLWNITGGNFPENFHMAAVRGTIGPFFEFDGLNPRKTKYFEWLRATIEAHQGLDLLILDPLSRFFGLEENRNEHMTAFISALENICGEYGITALVVHHTNKAAATSENLHKDGARGGGALSDAVRWQLSARIMPESLAEKYQLEAKDYIEIAVTKTNQTDYTGSIYFRKLVDGDAFRGFEYTDPDETRTALILDALIEEIQGTRLTRREIKQEKEGTEVANRIMTKTGCKRKEIAQVIDYGLEMGLLRDETEPTGKTKRSVLRPAAGGDFVA